MHVCVCAGAKVQALFSMYNKYCTGLVQHGSEAILDKKHILLP